MNITQSPRGRLSIFAAAMVIARRDFTAILLSRSFIFFLLGPLFPLIVGGLAGGIGSKVEQTAVRPQLGLAMQAADVDAMLNAYGTLAPRMGGGLPEFVVIARLRAGEAFDPREAMRAKVGNLAAIVSGSPSEPVLTGPAGRIEAWQGPLSMVAAQALGKGPEAWPRIALADTATSRADQSKQRVLTAQGAQVLLFLLTMLLAGMVLSNLVEEKGNKIIEILAAAIPMDAVFLGKLFAMLAISLVAIACWASAGAVLFAVGAVNMESFAAPAVGWPLMIALGVAYFATAYLLIGSVFLAIGSMATTVRDVQTLSLPATMLQLIVFFIASYAMARPGSPVELFATIFPFSSPFAMLARAAQDPAVWPHAAALVWQAAWVALGVKAGASLFRKRVMQSGPAGGRKTRRGLLARFRAA